jgi:patatin-like phospholipase/acyl hydrolase
MSKKYQILALNGGGFKGLYTAQVLARMEEESGKPIADLFDMISGTSIGGVIALALAKRVPAKEIVKLFTEKGDKIFPTPSPTKTVKFLMKSLFGAIHDNKPLRNEMVSLLGEHSTMKNLQTSLLIPTFNHTAGQPSMFKTNHDANKDWTEDQSVLLVDVAMATSAAPLYFPLYCNPESERHANVYSDGGMVGNAPGFFSYLEAIHSIGASPEDVHVLSITTTSSKKTIKSTEVKKYGLNWGLAGWNKQLFDTFMMSQEYLTHYFLLKQLPEGNYIRIDEKLTAEAINEVRLDNPSKGAIQTLMNAANTSWKNQGKLAKEFLKHEAIGVDYASKL